MSKKSVLSEQFKKRFKKMNPSEKITFCEGLLKKEKKLFEMLQKKQTEVIFLMKNQL